MIRAAILAAILARALISGLAATADDRPQDYVLTLVPEPRDGPVHAQEMLLLTLRGVYGPSIALERLDAPRLPGLAWVQLGHDRWSEEVVDGLARRVFERRLAVWAEAAGAITLPPFTHALTLAPRGGQRVAWPVVSAPLTLDFAPPPGDGADWWLPASAVALSEAWSGPTEALAIGEVSRRTVTLTAHGVGPDRLPPMPDLDAPGLFAFPEPETRSVRITPQGPVATVVWSWSILPESPQPAVAPPLRVAWFDTVARAPREATLPARRVAVDAHVLGVAPRDPRLERLAGWAAPGALAVGALLGATLAAAGFVGPSRRALGRRLAQAVAPLRRLAAQRRLRRAVAMGDAFAARRAAQALAPGEAALAAFDRLAYGPGGADPVALRTAAAALRRRR